MFAMTAAVIVFAVTVAVIVFADCSSDCVCCDCSSGCVCCDCSSDCVCYDCSKKTATWCGTVAGTLSSGCPRYFRSGTNILKESGWWALAQIVPPSHDTGKVTLPVSQSLLPGNSLYLI